MKQEREDASYYYVDSLKAQLSLHGRNLATGVTLEAHLPRDGEGGVLQ
jgi:hypothetical protein